MLNDPAKQQPMLVVLDAAADPASSTVLLDPNAIDTRRNHDHRLVPAVGGRQAGRRVAVPARQRDRHAPPLRDRDRQGDRRADPAGAGADRGRRPCLALRRFGVLVHALSGRGAAGGRPPLLPAGLFPQARHRLARRSAGARHQGRPAARRRNFSRRRQSEKSRRCAGAERRRWRVCALYPEPGRSGPARGLQGQDRRGRIEPERRDFCALARRRAERQGGEAAAAVCAVCAAERRRGRAGERRRHPDGRKSRGRCARISWCATSSAAPTRCASSITRASRRACCRCRRRPRSARWRRCPRAA